MDERAGTEPTTWEDWSRRDRDQRERAALQVNLRGRRARSGLAHEAATRAYQAARRTTLVATTVLAVPLIVGWVLVLRARDAAIEAGWGDRSFVPAGLGLLVLTVVLGAVILRWWRRLVRERPGRLELEVNPDSPEARRHPTFDGTNQPPRRW